ncbi:hypothetical protein BAE44_0026192, partial [Dichanthelium oligosanthes]
LVVLLLLSLGVAPAAACGGHPCPNPAGKCPLNAVKLGVCVDMLDGLVHVVVGGPPKERCCSLISGLANLEAAVCVYLAINANVLGVNLNIAVDLTLLVNYCAAACPPASLAPSRRQASRPRAVNMHASHRSISIY